MEIYRDAPPIYLIFAEPVVGNTLDSIIKTKIQDIWNGHLFAHHLKHVEIVVFINDVQLTYRGIGDAYDKDGNIVGFGGVEELSWRTYKRDEYKSWVQLDVSTSGFNACVNFCKEVANNPKTRYDDNFALRQIFPSCVPKDKHSYSCADFVCSALQVAGVIPESWDSSVTTTQQIYNATSEFGTPYFTELPFLKKKLNYE